VGVQVLRQLEEEVIDSPDLARAYAGEEHFTHLAADTVARLLNLAGDAPRQRMIDLGSGPATIARQVALARPGWRITAIDASKRMVLFGQVGINMAKLDDRVEMLHANAKETGLPDASFDIVFCSNFLHHMPDPQPLWQEIKRLAAPGALILIRDLRRPDSEPVAHKIVERDAHDSPSVFKDGFLQSLRAAFRIDEVRAQLQAARLDFLKVRPVGEYCLEVFGFKDAREQQSRDV
jgi:SAM-dependent methyltransferase